MSSKKEEFTISDLFNEIDKLNEHASTLDSPKHTEIKEWIPTGFYALNAAISADLYKGIPCGKLITLFGPSQAGKSVLSALIQKQAQDMGKTVILFDGEWDKDGRTEISFGVDTNKVKLLPINTIEQLINQSSKILDSIIKNGLQNELVMICDSLGGLSSDKETEDTVKNKVTQDMGLRAKVIRKFYRIMKAKCAIAGVPFIIINHDSENPNQLHPSSFKTQAGGKAIEFFSQVMVYVDKRKEKHDDKNPMDVLSAMSKGSYTGQTIKFFTQKNRCAAPHKEVECYINFKTGPDKYSGLIDIIDSLDTKILELKGRTYYLGDEKLGEFKKWRHDKNTWDKILPVLNEAINKEFQFSTWDGSDGVVDMGDIEDEGDDNE